MDEEKSIPCKYCGHLENDHPYKHSYEPAEQASMSWPRHPWPRPPKRQPSEMGNMVTLEAMLEVAIKLIKEHPDHPQVKELFANPVAITKMEEDCMDALRVFHLYAPAIKDMPWMKDIHKAGVQALTAGAIQMAADVYEAYKHRLIDAYSPEEQAIISKERKLLTTEELIDRAFSLGIEFALRKPSPDDAWAILNKAKLLEFYQETSGPEGYKEMYDKLYNEHWPMVEELKRLKEQCTGLGEAALANGRGLLKFEGMLRELFNGCGSHSCRVARPIGQGVNGPCNCAMKIVAARKAFEPEQEPT